MRFCTFSKAHKLSKLIRNFITLAHNKKNADAAIAEQLAEAEARIRKEQNKLHHVEEDSTTDKAWRQMLNPTK
ncbi:MAG TPA: hypothetical protein GXZ74_08400 [Tissierellia bacterium]|nr:hypothetical protein [Tissierellia bacterium]